MGRIRVSCFVQEFSVSPAMTTVNHGGFAFRPEDEDLRAAWNVELRRFIGSSEHVALVAAFGFSAEELPRMGVREEMEP